MASDSSDDEGVFVGPVTFKEMKWHLTKKFYTIAESTARHTVGPIELQNYKKSEEVHKENFTDNSTACNSIVYLDDSEDASDLKDLHEITTITLSDDDDDTYKPHDNISFQPRVKEECFSGNVLQASGEVASYIEKDSLCFRKSDFSGVHEAEDSLEINAPQPVLSEEYKQHRESVSQTDNRLQLPSEVSSFVSGNVRNYSEYSQDLTDEEGAHGIQSNAEPINYEYDSDFSVEYDSNAYDESDTDINLLHPYIEENKENLPKARTNKKPGKYDYLVSTVGKYIHQKPMGPPSVPVLPKKPKTPAKHTNIPVPKTLSAKKCYKDIKSPLAVYIKSAPTTPLMKQVTPKPLKTKLMFDTKQSSSPNDNLDHSFPKVFYKPAEHKEVTKGKEVNLPGSVKKLFPQNIQVIAHKDRIRTQALDDVSFALQKADQSCVSNTSVANSDISILSVKNVYIK